MIISDSIFSMDGDIAPLKEIVAIKERYGAVLFLDEAHAFGIYGRNGQGLAHELGLNNKIDIQMGTLSKAAGSEGGYICGKSDIIDYLRNKSRSFVFSTAPSIPSTAASIKAVEVIGSDFGLRKKLWENIDYFKTGLNKIAIASSNLSKLKHSTDCHVEPFTRLAITKKAESAIFCIKFDDIEKTLEFSNKLLEKHAIIASCIRPPTVKKPIIRLCTMALHSKQDLDYVLEKLSF